MEASLDTVSLVDEVLVALEAVFKATAIRAGVRLAAAALVEDVSEESVPFDFEAELELDDELGRAREERSADGEEEDDLALAAGLSSVEADSP